jgi:hypothetical protein
MKERDGGNGTSARVEGTEGTDERKGRKGGREGRMTRHGTARHDNGTAQHGTAGGKEGKETNRKRVEEGKEIQLTVLFFGQNAEGAVFTQAGRGKKREGISMKKGKESLKRKKNGRKEEMTKQERDKNVYTYIIYIFRICIYLSVSIYLSIYPSIYLSIYVSMHLSSYISIYICPTWQCVNPTSLGFQNAMKEGT